MQLVQRLIIMFIHLLKSSLKKLILKKSPGKIAGTFFFEIFNLIKYELPRHKLLLLLPSPLHSLLGGDEWFLRVRDL